MKNNILLRILYVLAFVVMIINTAFAVFQSLFPRISDLPEGKLIKSYVSPGQSSQVDFYLVKNNLGAAVRGERVVGNRHINIYWQTGIDDVSVQWVDEYGIIINKIPLNLKTDRFDSRRGTAIFSDGVLAENIAQND